MTFLMAIVLLLLTILVDGQDTGQAYWLPPASGDESAGGGGAAPASPGTSQYSVSPQAFYQGGAGAGGAAPASSLLDIKSGTAASKATLLGGATAIKCAHDGILLHNRCYCKPGTTGDRCEKKNMLPSLLHSWYV